MIETSTGMPEGGLAVVAVASVVPGSATEVVMDAVRNRLTLGLWSVDAHGTDGNLGGEIDRSADRPATARRRRAVGVNVDVADAVEQVHSDSLASRTTMLSDENDAGSPGVPSRPWGPCNSG